MSNDLDDRTGLVAAVALFAVIFVLIGWDVLIDYREGASLPHIVIELAVLVLTLIGVILLWSRLRRTRLDLAVAIKEADQWRRESRELLQGLGVVIERQFKRWSLTRAESEVGLLMLKGLSHKQIAAVRQTSERTIREQARALYRKSGLSGRNALSAFFLEDLLLPARQDGSGE